MIKKIFFIGFLTLVVFLIFETTVYAGGMGMGPPSEPCGVGNFPPCPVAVPLDGGVLLLAGAGIVMGARKMMKKK